MEQLQNGFNFELISNAKSMPIVKEITTLGQQLEMHNDEVCYGELILLGYSFDS